MEILNNIWVALSTPNEGLLNVLSIPLYFVENLLTMYLFLNLTKITSTRKQQITYIILMSVLSIITISVIPSPFNIYINYFIMFPVAYLIFRKNSSFIKICASIALALIIYNILGGFFLNPYITFFKISTDELSTIPIYRLFYMFIIYIVITLIISLLRYKNIQLKFVEEIDTKSKYTIIASSFLGIITIVVQSVTLFYYVETLPIIITFLSFITLLSYFLINIYSINRMFKLFLTRKELESEKLYNQTLRILHDSVRGFKHDFDNTVTTIGGYVRTNDMEGLKKYYLQLEDDCQKVNTLYVLNPEIINNDGIYNLLTTKYHEAEEKGIKVTITVLLDLGNLKMRIYDFARILGILLDNAIEASSESDEKIINIIFRNDAKNSRQLIIIENSYKDKNVDTEKIFEKGASGKENHTGLGLWEVRKILKKTNNANLFTSKTDTLFSQQLEIYY